MKQDKDQEKVGEKTYRMVAAIIRSDNKYLCTQQGRSHYAYISEHWEFPGGKVEEGEPDHEALVREIKEEMDQDVFMDKKVGTMEFHYPDFNIHLTAYLYRGGDGEFKMLGHLDYKWLTIDELNDLKWTGANRKLMEILKTKTTW